MEELIAKLEAATEGSRDLDWFIGKAVGVIPVAWLDTHRSADFLSYTTSLDDAMTLADDLRGLMLYRATQPDMGGKDWGLSSGSIRIRARSWPFAICIAALKARVASQTVAVEHIGKAG